MGTCQLKRERWQLLEAVYYPNAMLVQVALLLSRACTFLPHIGSTCLWFQPIRPSLRGRIGSESLCPRLDFVDHHFGQGNSAEAL